MCGLVGAAGALGVKEEKLFKQLLIIDAIRGEHSTGIAAVDSVGEVHIAKAVGNPYNLLDTHSADNIFRRNTRVLIGHNRYATIGEVNRRNAHPFEFDNIVGVHNGTLRNKHNLPNHYTFGTDSEALYSYINEVGIKQAIEETEGAWCLTYYNKEEQTLNLLRNEERPLHYLLSKDGKVVFWASEAWMLTVILSRDKYEFQPIQELPPNMLMSFKIHIGVGPVNNLPELEKPKGKKVEGKKPVKTHTNYGEALKKPWALTDDYLHKERILHLQSLMDDEKTGAKYISCYDKENPENFIRLYIQKDDANLNLLGKKVKCHVSSFVGTVKEGYYKVSPWSIKPLTDLSVVNTKFVPKLNGRVLSMVEYNRKHSHCDYCGGPIPYGDVSHVYKDGSLCEVCMKDEELLKIC